MKRILFLCMMLTGLVTYVAAQKATIKVSDDKNEKTVTITAQQNGGAVTVVSDTTDTAEADTMLDFGDEASGTSSGVIHEEFPFNFNDLGFSLGNDSIIIAILVLLLIFGGPLLLLILIIYFIFRTRNAKYELAREALRQGKELPQNVVKPRTTTNETMWEKGIKNICLGVGLFFLLWAWTNFEISMIGVLILCTGVGQIIISRTTKQPTTENTQPKHKGAEAFRELLRQQNPETTPEGEEATTETVPEEHTGEDETK